MSILRIYGIARTRAFRALWIAKEVGLAYEHFPLEIGDEGASAPEFLAMNPNGRLPFIDDNGFVLFESLAITLYLSRKSGKLWPKDVRGEAVAFQWTLWAATEVEGALGGWFYHTRFLPEAERKPEIAQESAAKLPRRFDVLEGALAQSPWLAGEAFGIADLNVSGVTYRAPAFGLERCSSIHPRESNSLAGRECQGGATGGRKDRRLGAQGDSDRGVGLNRQSAGNSPHPMSLFRRRRCS